jgi:hypothetical protein
MQAMTQMMEMNFVMGNVCDKLDRVERRGNEAIGHQEGLQQPRN